MPDKPVKKPTMSLSFEIYHDPEKRLIRGVEWVLIDPAEERAHFPFRHMR